MDIPAKPKKVETRAHVNIALIKYWGKKNVSLKIPFQSSISLTLDQFYTDTTISESKIGHDQLTINGKQATEKELSRIIEFLNLFRKMYHQDQFFIINSTNHVYKAAGLASSSSAFASIAVALNAFCRLNLTDENVSKLARLGSGSASRSIYGGFAVWHHGNSHETSFAKPINIDWKALRMAFIIVDHHEKSVSSSKAMQTSVAHESYQDYLAQAHLDFDEFIKHLPSKNIDKIGPIMERNAVLMHDTIRKSGHDYYTDQTRTVIDVLNQLKNVIPLYYTLDAGPNIKVLMLEEHVSMFQSYFNQYEVVICKEGPKAYVKSID